MDGINLLSDKDEKQNLKDKKKTSSSREIVYTNPNKERKTTKQNWLKGLWNTYFSAKKGADKKKISIPEKNVKTENKEIFHSTTPPPPQKPFGDLMQKSSQHDAILDSLDEGVVTPKKIPQNPKNVIVNMDSIKSQKQEIKTEKPENKIFFAKKADKKEQKKINSTMSFVPKQDQKVQEKQTPIPQKKEKKGWFSSRKKNTEEKKPLTKEKEKVVKTVKKEVVQDFLKTIDTPRDGERPTVSLSKNKTIKDIEYSSPAPMKRSNNGRRLGNIDVNLVPSGYITVIEKKNYLGLLGWIGLGAFVFVTLIYASLSIYDYKLASNTEQVNQEIQQVDKDINHYLNLQKEADLLKKRIVSAEELLRKHIYWSLFLNRLQTATIPNVYYQGITGDINGNFKLTAVGKSFNDVADQLRVLEAADFVDEVDVSGGTKTTVQTKSEQGDVVTTEEQVQFSITLKIDESVFTEN